MKRINVHLVPGYFDHASRVIKESDSLIRLGLVDEIIVFAQWREGLKEKEEFGANRTIIRTRLISNRLPKSLIADLLKYAEFFLRVFLSTLRISPTHLNCHSINILIAGVAVKLIKKSTILIYDAHELETERSSLKEGFPKEISKKLERFFMKYVDKTCFVSKPIAEWYQAEYGIKELNYIPNIPMHPTKGKILERTNKFRIEFDIPESHIIFIYQGILDGSRSVERYIDIFSRISDKTRHFVIMGFGPLMHNARKAAAENENIHFKDAVSPYEVLGYTCSADVGLFFEPDPPPLNHKYMMPNKFFQYVLAGLHVITTSNTLEISRYVREEKLGDVIDSNIEAMEKRINEVTREHILSLKQQSGEFRANISWDSYDEVYERLYS